MATRSNWNRPGGQSKYEKDYIEALDLNNADKYAEAVAMVKYNLTDTTLPRYWRVKNRILAAFATTDFQEAERFRQEGEEIWKEADAGTPQDNIYERRALDDLREGLDALGRSQQEDIERFQNGEAEEDEEDEDEEIEEDEDEEDEVERLMAPGAPEEAEQLAEAPIEPEGVHVEARDTAQAPEIDVKAEPKQDSATEQSATSASQGQTSVSMPIRRSVSCASANLDRDTDFS